MLHRFDEEGYPRSDVVVGEQSGERVHGLNSLLLDLGFQVVHTALDDGDQAGQLGAHGLAEDVLLDSLLLGRANSHLRLVGHLLKKLVGADGALPLARLSGQVLHQHGQKTRDESLGTQVAKEGIEAVLGGLADNGALVGQSVQRARHEPVLLDEEDNLANVLAGREALEDGAE